MVRGPRVTPYADVPVAARPGAERRLRDTRTGAAGDDHATAVSRRAGGGWLGKRGTQRHHVLLVQRSRAEATHADIERAVLPDDVVVQHWVRGAPAAAVGRRSRGRKVSGRTYDRRRQVRPQRRAVLNSHEAGGLAPRYRQGLGTGAVRVAANAAGPLSAGQRSAQR